MTRVRVGLIGDHDPSVTAHRAIPRALELAGGAEGVEVTPEWLPTESLEASRTLEPFDGLWCVPASPYRSMSGALRAIRFARERRRPFLGTCGGFQHALLEYARHVLGWNDAEHGETAPGAARAVVSPLACALVEVSHAVRIHEGSHLASAYRQREVVEGYHCRYGLNVELRDALLAGALRVTAEDAAGEVRAVELEDHPFFVATLFQPERAALRNRVPPIVAAFVRAAAQHRAPPRARVAGS